MSQLCMCGEQVQSSTVCARRMQSPCACFVFVQSAPLPASSVAWHSPAPPPPLSSNTHIEEEINRLRAELLRKDQEAERMQLALAAEKEERERAQVGGLVSGDALQGVACMHQDELLAEGCTAQKHMH